MYATTKRGHVLAATAAAGFLVLTPAVASAETPAPGQPNQATETPQPAPGSSIPTAPTATVKPIKPGDFGLSVQEGVVGAKLTATAMCSSQPKLASQAITFTQAVTDAPAGQESVFHYSGVVNDVKPGKYDVTLVCGQDKGKELTKAVSFTVLAKRSGPAPSQITRVPAGAPQTGGGGTQDGPADLTAIWLGVGALAAAGGVGFALHRRRLAAREN